MHGGERCVCSTDGYNFVTDLLCGILGSVPVPLLWSALKFAGDKNTALWIRSLLIDRTRLIGWKSTWSCSTPFTHNHDDASMTTQRMPNYTVAAPNGYCNNEKGTHDEL